VAARRLVAGGRPEGRHVDRGAARGPGVRVGGASGERVEHGCPRGIGRAAGPGRQWEFRVRGAPALMSRMPLC